MQRVYFCTGASFLTGNDVADAVLEYAWVLAQYGRHDLVRVPTRHADGSAGRSSLLLGPMSQISTEDARPTGDELVDQQFVRGLQDRSAHFREPLPFADFDDSFVVEEP